MGLKGKEWNNTGIALLIFIAGLVLSCCFLMDREFIRLECRMALFVREMDVHGFTFFPMLYGEAYPDYPSTQTFLIYLISKFAGLNILTAVFPSAVFAALSLAFTYLVGTFHSRRLGLVAVFLLIATEGFFSLARSPSPDHFICAVTVILFYVLYLSDLRKTYKNFIWLPLLLILGFAFRGPIGFVIPAAVVFVFYLIGRRFRMLFAVSVLMFCLLALCCAGLAWAAYIQGGKELVRQVFEAQAHGRMASVRPFYFYFLYSFRNYSLCYPLALIVLLTNLKFIFGKNDEGVIRLMRLLAGWTLIIMLGLSVPGTKHLRYILPAIPAMALIAAFTFVEFRHKHYFLCVIDYLVVRLSILLPFVGMAGVWIVYFIAQNMYPDVQIPLTAPFILFMLSGLGALYLSGREKEETRKSLIMLFAGAFSFAVLHMFIVEPLELCRNLSGPFVKKIEDLRDAGQKIIFYKLGPDGEDLRYVVNSNRALKPAFIMDEKDILSQGPSAFIITKEKYYSRLPDEILDRVEKLSEGDLGHRKCIVFKVLPGFAVQDKN